MRRINPYQYDLDDEKLKKLSKNTFKIVHANIEATKEVEDEVKSHHSSERPQESQAGPNLEQRVNNNMGVHEQPSEDHSLEEDGFDSEIDGMCTNFATAIGTIRPNEIADVLKNAELDPELIGKVIRYRSITKAKHLIDDDNDSNNPQLDNRN